MPEAVEKWKAGAPKRVRRLGEEYFPLEEAVRDGVFPDMTYEEHEL